MGLTFIGTLPLAPLLPIQWTGNEDRFPLDMMAEQKYMGYHRTSNVT